MEKGKIHKVLDKYWDIEGELTDLHKQIHDAIDKYGEDYVLRVDQDFDRGERAYQLTGERLETDDEHEQRVKKERKIQEDRLAYDKKLFDELKKKHGWT